MDSMTQTHFREWGAFEDAVAGTVAAVKNRRRSPSSVVFFRGQGAGGGYGLTPSLLRPAADRWYTPSDEHELFYEFQSRGGAILPPGLDSWDLLFLMRHHGAPTRLLDWSEGFAAALFFALREEDAERDLDLWLLDPYALNSAACGIDDVLDVGTDLKHSYFEYFVDGRATPEWAHAVAIYPQRRSTRLSGQLATFTLHASCTPLERTGLPGLTQLTLAASGRRDAERYLEMAGINDFSLYPDLDGLAALLRRRFRPHGECEWPA